MIESLRRKKDVLTDILKLSEEQSLLLDDPNLEPDTFEKNVNRKAALIEKLGTDQGTYRIEYADSGNRGKK